MTETPALRVLITGASGKVGYALCQHFVSAGHHVVAAVRSDASIVPPAQEIILCHLGTHPLPRIRVDLVIHAAAQNPQSADQSVSGYIRSNVLAIEDLCAFAREVQPKLVVFFSSLSVYGEIVTDSVSESTPLGAPGIYGATKYLGELMLEASGVSSVSLRLPGILGPNCLTSWVGRTLVHLVKGEGITITNPDALFNNVIDTHELQRLICFLYGRAPTPHEVYVIGATEPLRITDVVATLAKEVNSRSAMSVGVATQQAFRVDIAALEAIGFQMSPTRSILERFARENQEVLRSRV